MSELTIGDIPEEVMAEVFKFLDPESLQNAVLTTKDWKEVIERNIPWSLIINYLNAAWVDPVMASNRKFRKVVIEGMWVFKSNKKLEFFKKHGGNIREMILYDCGIVNPTIWCQVLETMTKLKKVVMRGTIALVSIEDLSAELLPSLQKLPQLTTVEMVESCAELLKSFQNCQLQTLKFLCSSEDDQPRDPLLNFLATQKDLEVLALRSIDYGKSKLFESPIPVNFIPFKLKKLSLQGINLREAPNDYNNLIEFMKPHAKTLEEIELGRTFPDFFIEFVFAQFKKLKVLSLMESTIPRGVGFFERLEVNSSVTSLKLTGEQTSRDNITFALKQLVSHLPNIESLFLLGYNDNSIAQHIAENLKELKNLTVANFNGEAFDGVQFQALQSLRILNLNASIDWDSFTKANADIVDLSIKTVSDLEHLDMQAITQNWKLRKLVIEDKEMNCNENFFNIIRENCPQLKSVDLHAGAKKVDISSIADIPGLRFRENDFFVEQFPPEGNFWNQDDYDGEIPADDHNWTEEAAGVDPEMMDPFDLHLMVEDLDIDRDDDVYYDDDVWRYDGDDGPSRGL